MVNQIYATELQLNKASVSDTSCLDLHISIADSFITTKIYDKRDDFDLLIFIPRPKGSGDIAMSLTSVRPSVSCPLYNLNTVWNILMILHSYVEQVMTMCRVQK